MVVCMISPNFGGEVNILSFGIDWRQFE
jgi:hypothetical protein